MPLSHHSDTYVLLGRPSTRPAGCRRSPAGCSNPFQTLVPRFQRRSCTPCPCNPRSIRCRGDISKCIDTRAGTWVGRIDLRPKGDTNLNRSYCPRLCTGPMDTAGSNGFPTFMVCASATSSSRTASYTTSWTYMRFMLKHVCPALLAAPSRMRLRSRACQRSLHRRVHLVCEGGRWTYCAICLGFTSSRTIAGSFPPSSRVISLSSSAASRMTAFPAPVEPVMDMRRMRGCRTIHSPLARNSEYQADRA